MSYLNRLPFLLLKENNLRALWKVRINNWVSLKISKGGGEIPSTQSSMETTGEFSSKIHAAVRTANSSPLVPAKMFQWPKAVTNNSDSLRCLLGLPVGSASWAPGWTRCCHLRKYMTKISTFLSLFWIQVFSFNICFLTSAGLYSPVVITPKSPHPSNMHGHTHAHFETFSFSTLIQRCNASSP